MCVCHQTSYHSTHDSAVSSAVAGRHSRFPNQTLSPVWVTLIISLFTVMINESVSSDSQPVRDFEFLVSSPDG